MPLNCSSFGLRQCVGFSGYQRCKGNWVWGDLGQVGIGGCGFRGRGLTGCLGLALVFVWGGAQRGRGGLISVFGKFSASIGKTFTLAWRLGAGLSFCEALRQPVRQLVYAMFISNNRPSFHLWWKENLVKHRKVWKYYETDCS